MRTCPSCSQKVPAQAVFCSVCGARIDAAPSSAEDPFIGRIVKDAYFVEAWVGSGGMGDVYRARHLNLGAPLALKFLKRSLLADPSVVRRFQREARAASRLRHPNIVHVSDFGQLPDGTLFMAMEYVTGKSLARVIAEEFPFEEERIVRVAGQILSALAEAHESGILHRDLKPDNVMLEARRHERDVVRVLDFGIAKLQAVEEGGPTLTRAGIVCGTPGYMSPEQWNADPLDGRSDLYSVGVILYEMLTGRRPLDGRTPLEMIRKLLSETVAPPSTLREPGAISPELEALVMRALSTSRDDRPSDAAQMCSLLMACAVRDGPSSATAAMQARGARSRGPPTVVLEELAAPQERSRGAEAPVETHLDVAAPPPAPPPTVPPRPAGPGPRSRALQGRRVAPLAAMVIATALAAIFLVLSGRDRFDVSPSAARPSDSTPHALEPRGQEEAPAAPGIPSAPPPSAAAVEAQAATRPEPVGATPPHAAPSLATEVARSTRATEAPSSGPPTKPPARAGKVRAVDRGSSPALQVAAPPPPEAGGLPERAAAEAAAGQGEGGSDEFDPNGAAPAAASFAVEYASARATTWGGEIGDVVYSEKADDAAVEKRKFSRGLLIASGTVGRGRGSSWGGVGLLVKLLRGGSPYDASAYRTVTVWLASPSAERLRLRLVGADAKRVAAGCYPVATVAISDYLAAHEVPFTDFRPESYCGSMGLSADDTLPGLVGLEVVDTEVRGTPTSFTMGRFELNP